MNEAHFNNPLGVCVVGDVLYVFNTDSHRDRCVDLLGRTINALMGTGVMGTNNIGGKRGVERLMSSPRYMPCGARSKACWLPMLI